MKELTQETIEDLKATHGDELYRVDDEDHGFTLVHRRPSRAQVHAYEDGESDDVTCLNFVNQVLAWPSISELRKAVNDHPALAFKFAGMVYSTVALTKGEKASMAVIDPDELLDEEKAQLKADGFDVDTESLKRKGRLKFSRGLDGQLFALKAPGRPSYNAYLNGVREEKPASAAYDLAIDGVIYPAHAELLKAYEAYPTLCYVHASALAQMAGSAISVRSKKL